MADKKAVRNKVKFGYKIVREGVLNEFFSVSVGIGCNGLVIYIPGREITPNEDCGPLSVYTNWQYAKHAFDNLHLHATGSKVIIFHCKYIESHRKGMWYPNGRGISIMHDHQAPYGTVYADKVVITRPVEHIKARK